MLRQFMIKSVHIFFHDINSPQNINEQLEERENPIDLLMQMSNTKKSNVSKSIKEITEESLEQVCLLLCLRKRCILNPVYIEEELYIKSLGYRTN